MSKFIIGNTEINRISGPIRVVVLKPPQKLKESLEKEGGRAPYVLLFGDYHFERENECSGCSCSWADEDDCCFKLDDPKFLKLFDSVSSKNFPIDLYIEQVYEPRIADPNIYNINPYMKNLDNKGFLSKFLHDYKICYSKNERGSQRYIKECPTKDVRWHYVDIRNIKTGNSGEATLSKGMEVFSKLISNYFENSNKYTTVDTYTESKKYAVKYEKELEMIFYIVINGPQFVKDYITESSNFILAKQIRKQSTDELRDFSLWHKIIGDRLETVFARYIGKSENISIYIDVIKFYKQVILLIFDTDISRIDFEIKRLELINTVTNYDLKEDTIFNIYYMLFMTTLSVMMDVYTITRILKKPEGGIPAFLAIHYAGDVHVSNIRDILVKYFDYTIVGEISDEQSRCQDVSNIPFNVVKAKNEYY